LANAVKYTHTGGNVSVEVRTTEETVSVEVSDDGAGIAPEVLPRVFDPFFTTKPPGEGSGLGLSVSYGIVTEHGGRLRSDNRRDGGAVFTIELPWGDARR